MVITELGGRRKNTITRKQFSEMEQTKSPLPSNMAAEELRNRLGKDYKDGILNSFPQIYFFQMVYQNIN